MTAYVLEKETGTSMPKLPSASSLAIDAVLKEYDFPPIMYLPLTAPASVNVSVNKPFVPSKDATPSKVPAAHAGRGNT